MAYDEDLAQRVRELLSERIDLSERKMFGGICFMVGGNMCAGVLNDDLIARVGEDGFEDALAREHARPFDFGGRPSKGIVYVAPGGTSEDADLRDWVDRSLDFAGSLPPKR